MKWFMDLKIGTKLITSFLFVALVGAFIGYQGIVSLKEADESDTILYERNTVPVSQIGTIAVSFQRMRCNMYEIVTAKNDAEIAELLKRITDRREEIGKLIAVLEGSIASDDVQKAFDTYLDARKEYLPLVEDYVGHVKAGQLKDAEVLLKGPLEKARKNYQASIESWTELLIARAKHRSEMNTENVSSATMFMLTIAGFGFAISVVLGFVIARIISGPVNELVANIANADLNSRFNSTRKDEIGGLQKAFDGFVDQIKNTLVQVSESSAAVASASTEISSSTEQLAAGAQEQSSQSAEVAGAVEEMTKTIIENSRNASDTADTAKRAKATAEKGGNVVRQTVEGMKDIAKVVNKSADTVKALGRSSDQIGEIISVIDDIADQTNLLALNAAIEAARAGEQGRGFAVVADEVRKLAERTTKATKEIASMIKQIQTDTKDAVFSMDEGTKKVNDGILLADQAGESLKEIMEISQLVTDKVAQIAAASEQQSSASEQISKNVEAISSVTQESASGTQQIARTAEDLNRLTENLQELLNKFNLGGTTAAAPTRHDAYQRPKTTVQRSRKAVTEHGHLVEH
ncbi:MAG: methyl-accepting chemotaxis protein [Bacteroidetes bacterium]|nr:methyl-accepting chemotaxis protein [Bacteroidota bacterium]